MKKYPWEEIIITVKIKVNHSTSKTVHETEKELKEYLKEDGYQVVNGE